MVVIKLLDLRSVLYVNTIKKYIYKLLKICYNIIVTMKGEMKMIYIAYGSNMDIYRMLNRCPNAELVGKGVLNNWRLMFKTSLTGAYATIERQKGYKVPVLLWDIDEVDEHSLDRYEGCPRYYYKKRIRLSDTTAFVPGEKISKVGIVYIMHEDHIFNLPTMQYYKLIYNAYQQFGFNISILQDGVQYSADQVNRRLA